MQFSIILTSRAFREKRLPEFFSLHSRQGKIGKSDFLNFKRESKRSGNSIFSAENF